MQRAGRFVCIAGGPENKTTTIKRWLSMLLAFLFRHTSGFRLAATWGWGYVFGGNSQKTQPQTKCRISFCRKAALYTSHPAELALQANAVRSHRLRLTRVLTSEFRDRRFSGLLAKCLFERCRGSERALLQTPFLLMTPITLAMRFWVTCAKCPFERSAGSEKALLQTLFF